MSAHVVLREDLFFAEPGHQVELRLTYAGPLYGSSKKDTRAKHKQEIRKRFHPQLRRLWGTHPLLIDKDYVQLAGLGSTSNSILQEEGRLVDFLSNNHRVCGYGFVPLASSRLALKCKLDVLLLQPNAHGSRVLQCGDIDNRLKTLFDALRMPKNKEELGGYDDPSDDERPFYVLLEDDSSVDQVSVTMDALLESLSDRDIKDNDARVLVTVTLRPFISVLANIGV